MGGKELASCEIIWLSSFCRAFTLAQLHPGVEVLSISRMLVHTSTVLVWKYAKQAGIDFQEAYNSLVDGDEYQDMVYGKGSIILARSLL